MSPELVEAENILEMEKCTAIAVNAHIDTMRGWGIELMAKINEELALKIGEWIILNTDEIAEEEHFAIFRAIRNATNYSISEKVVMKGLEARNTGVNIIAIKYVNQENFSQNIERRLLAVREKIPVDYDYVKGMIDKKLESGGASDV